MSCKKIIIYCPLCKNCEPNSSMGGYLFIINDLLKSNGIESEIYFNKTNESMVVHIFKMFREIVLKKALILCVSQEFILPFYPKKQIVFFHDLIQISYPRKKKVYVYYKYYIAIIARHVLANITTAKSTQEKLSALSIKSEVVYRLHLKKDLEIKFNREKKYFAAFVGTNAIHKNIEIFIKAAIILEDRKFIIIVPDYVKNQLSLHIYKNIELFSNMSQLDYNEILQQTEFFVSSSFEEGYGPIWDGLRNGCKCLLSDIAVYRELFEKVARFFNPYDVNQLVSLMTNYNYEFNKEYFEAIDNIIKKMKESEKKLVNITVESLKNA